jgi:ketosteroid isomerase-like protein
LQPSDIVISFVEAINAHDVTKIVDLCSKDHQFVDAYDNIVAAAQLHAAWSAYFQFMPQYGIEIDSLVGAGDVVAVFGHAFGSLAADGDQAGWRRPAAWQARVKDGLVSLWQVYVDTKIVFDLLAKKATSGP